MRLCNPGEVIAAPALTGRAGEIAAAVERLPGVASHTHWMLGDPTTVDGAEYHLGEEAIGHVHLDGSVHLPMGTLTRPLVDAGLAAYTPWSREWATLSQRREASAEDAVWLFELACARASGVAESELADRIRTRAGRHRQPHA